MNALASSLQNFTQRRAVRRGLAALGLVLGLLAPLTAPAAGAPASPVPFTKALADAQRVVRMHRDWQVVMAQGNSMAPQFGDNSLLLVTKTPFTALRAGMVVVYRDPAGDLVAHRLVEQTADGWLAKGMNNERTDPGLVTQDNLTGVIFGLLHYKPGTADVVALAPAARLPVALAKTY